MRPVQPQPYPGSVLVHQQPGRILLHFDLPPTELTEAQALDLAWRLVSAVRSARRPPTYIYGGNTT